MQILIIHLLLEGGVGRMCTPCQSCGQQRSPPAPARPAPPRSYQHGAVFVGARLHIFGGAVGGGRMVDTESAVVVLDTSAGQWVKGGADSPQVGGWAGRVGGGGGLVGGAGAGLGGGPRLRSRPARPASQRAPAVWTRLE